MISNQRIFVTGGAGFIARKLISKIVEENKIVVYDNFCRSSASEEDFLSHPNIELVYGDVTDADLLKKSMDGADIVIHTAAIVGIESTIKDPVETMRINLIGTANVLDAAVHQRSVVRFIDFSTSEVFGNYAYKVEESSHAILGAVGEARWIYAVSKLAGEHWAHAYFKKYGLPTVTLRPFNIYGPGQIGEGAVSIFIRKALANEDLFVFGDGSQIRAWCYIDDMVEAAMLALTRAEAVGETLNIGNPRAVVTVHGLAEAVIRSVSSRSRIVFKPALSADIELRIPKVDKAREILGFEARVDLDEGLRRTARWIEQEGDRLPQLSPMFRG